MMTLSDGLAEIRQLLQNRGEPKTEPQKRWVDRLLKAEQLFLDAISLQEQAAADPDNEVAQKRFVVRQGQARLELDRIRRGVASHRRNYTDAHGETTEERREGWNQAYADRVGRDVREYKKKSDMTPEAWAERQRKKSSDAKARYRAKKKNPAS